MRRLAGGVVAASRGRRSSRSPIAPPGTRARLSPPPAGGLLIDGIPDSILAATRTRRPAAPPRDGASPRREHDTGSLSDTTEPGSGFVERISEGTHTTIQPPDAAATPLDDPAPAHRSTRRSTTTTAPPSTDPSSPRTCAHGTGDTVLAVSCPTGH